MKNLILIDLDSLLDTRTGVLFEIDETEAVNILNKGWINREADCLDKYSDVITTEQYKEAYENRSKYTLSLSRPTNVMLRLAPEIRKIIISGTKSNSRAKDYCLVINVHPYNLTDSEAKDIQTSVAETLGENTPVRIVDMLTESTRLSNLELREFTDYITYDIHGWIKREFSDVVKMEDFVSSPGISIWGPMLASSDNAHANLVETEPDLSEKDDPWEFLKITFAPFVSINWMAVNDFSLLNYSA